MEKVAWIPIKRNFQEESKRGRVRSQVVTDHPLIVETKQVVFVNNVSEDSKPKTSSNDLPAKDPLGADPLSVDPLGAIDPLGAVSDPLNSFSEAPNKKIDILSLLEKKEVQTNKSIDTEMESFTPWATKKTGILQKYTTSDKLTITTSFLSSKDIPKVETTKAKLESLEEGDEDTLQTMLNLSQQDYVTHIDDLQQQLTTAWDGDQRVKCLKIAIQSSKLLCDTKVPQFYPSKFVLITEILDTFGDLVYDRIFRKAAINEPGSPYVELDKLNFTPDQVSDVAKETCKNWFYKIASIRELIPRLYVEMALLKSYRFLAQDEYSIALKRLADMIRGVGDPMVAVYCRAYLCRKGMEVAHRKRDHLLGMFYDFMFAYRQLNENNVSSLLKEYNITFTTYLDLLTPAVDWILQCVAFKSPPVTLEKILSKYTEYCNNALVLDSIISSFPPDYVSQNAPTFCDLISKADVESFPQYQLYHTLGVNLVLSPPSKDIQIKVMDHVWKVISQLQDAGQYVKCAEVYVEIPAKTLGFELNGILGDIIEHTTPEKVYEKYLPQIQSMIEKILTHTTDFNSFFGMSNLMPMLDMFQSHPIRVDVSKSIMSYFVKSPDNLIQDPIVINGLLFVARNLHDSITALTFDDERRQISDLILGFLRRVSYGRDFEEQLNFYVASRSNFCNLDTVLQFLVQSACSLVMQVHKILKGNNTRKTAAFIRAAVGYCYITIPSIISVPARLQLYLLSAQVALTNQCIPQSESLFKAACSLITDLPTLYALDGSQVGKNLPPFEFFLIPYLCNFLSTLVILPGNPENGPFYILKTLLNNIQEYEWIGGGENKIFVYEHVLCLLSSMKQDQLPYRIESMELNDVLYDGDERYFVEIDSIINTTWGEILKKLNEMPDSQLKSEIALRLFNRYTSLCEMSNETVNLAVNLLIIAKSKLGSSPSFKNTISHITAMAKNSSFFARLLKS